MRVGVLHVYALVYVALLYLPSLLLPIFAFNAATTPTFPLAGFTTRWFVDLWNTPAIHQAAWNSLRVGLATAVLSTLLGLCAARAITRYRFRGRQAASALIMAPLVLPEIIIGVSLLIVLLGMGMSLSLVTVTMGHVLICLPYSTIVLIAGFEGFDRSLEEASLDLGETGWGTFRRVILPLVAPAVVASLLVSFTISLDEFLIAFFLAGNEATLPIYIWGQLRFAARLPVVLALGTILLVASVLMVTLAEVLRRRALRRAGGMG